jgi:hypothetical protein
MTTTQGGMESGSSVRDRVMSEARAIAGDPPTPRLRSIVCPYCGRVTPDGGRCVGCAGRFDPLSRQATQNQMGPWEIRDEKNPFRPGCSYATLVRLIDQGGVKEETVLRGPSTRQFWMLAKHTPGVGHRFGYCHNCRAEVKKDAFSCPSCESSFEVERDRQHMGLGPARPLPGQGLPEVLALHAEPASPSRTSAVASASIAPASPGGRVEFPNPGGNEDDRKRVEDSLRLVELWRSKASSDRQHAYAVMVISMLITLSALGYILIGGQMGQSAPEKASGSVGIVE